MLHPGTAVVLILLRLSLCSCWEYCTPGSVVNGLTCDVTNPVLFEMGPFSPGVYPQIIPADGSDMCFLSLGSNGTYHFGFHDLDFQCQVFSNSQYQLLGDFVGVPNVLIRSGSLCQSLSADKEYIMNATSFCCTYRKTNYSDWSWFEKISLTGNILLLIIAFILGCCLRRTCLSASISASRHDQNVNIQLDRVPLVQGN